MVQFVAEHAWTIFNTTLDRFLAHLIFLLQFLVFAVVLVETTIFYSDFSKSSNFKDTPDTICEHTCVNCFCQNVCFSAFLF